MTQAIVISSFYKFVRLQGLGGLRTKLHALCGQHGILGTILLAEEGLNATVSGTRNAIDELFMSLRSDPRFRDLDSKEFDADRHPFYRLKVRLKREIVTFGVDGIDPTRRVGEYISPEDWNPLIQDPDVLVVDTRNRYEVHIGTFQGARDPGLNTFREFPQYADTHLYPNQHQRVAMFCTGGIRCEKATAYLLNQGFDEVYHLQGGILNYLSQVSANQSLWEGECFVFDQRVAVDGSLTPGSHVLCYACQEPVATQEVSSPLYEKGVSCPRCFGTLEAKKIAALRERQHQIELARQRNQSHFGTPPAASHQHVEDTQS